MGTPCCIAIAVCIAWSLACGGVARAQDDPYAPRPGTEVVPASGASAELPPQWTEPPEPAPGAALPAVGSIYPEDARPWRARMAAQLGPEPAGGGTYLLVGIPLVLVGSLVLFVGVHEVDDVSPGAVGVGGAARLELGWTVVAGGGAAVGRLTL